MSGQDADVNLMNQQHWKMLCTHAPEASSIACESANWASAAKYFKVGLKLFVLVIIIN